MANRKRKRDKNKRVDLDKLDPKLAAGITTGPDSFAEANEKFPKLPGAVDLSYLNKAGGVKFRARNAREPVGAMNFGDDRWFMDVDVMFTREDRLKIERGYMCLRCLEPQSSCNADDHLPGCPGVAMHGERYMRGGHMIIEVAAEFVGVEHLGPRVPLAEHVRRQDERRDRLQWIKDQVERGNGEAAMEEYRKLAQEAKSAAQN